MRRASACDVATATIYPVGTDDDGKPIYGCRCIICARCGRHTGNSNQGHYWTWCSTTKSMRVPHFCCPDDCALEAQDAKDLGVQR